MRGLLAAAAYQRRLQKVAFFLWSHRPASSARLNSSPVLLRSHRLPQPCADRFQEAQCLSGSPNFLVQPFLNNGVYPLESRLAIFSCRGDGSQSACTVSHNQLVTFVLSQTAAVGCSELHDIAPDALAICTSCCPHQSLDRRRRRARADRRQSLYPAPSSSHLYICRLVNNVGIRSQQINSLRDRLSIALRSPSVIPELSSSKSTFIVVKRIVRPIMAFLDI